MTTHLQHLEPGEKPVWLPIDRSGEIVHHVAVRREGGPTFSVRITCTALASVPLQADRAAGKRLVQSVLLEDLAALRRGERGSVSHFGYAEIEPDHFCLTIKGPRASEVDWWTGFVRDRVGRIDPPDEHRDSGCVDAR